jgi:enoyl-CoA hydratase
MSLVHIERRGSLALITLQRPDKLNAINKEMIAALHGALDAVEADGGVRAIVLQGAGRAFSAGFDLDMEVDTSAGKPDPEAVRRALRNDFDIIMRFWDSPKPTVAAVPLLPGQRHGARPRPDLTIT